LDELLRIPLPRTPVNRPSPQMRQAASAGNISGATAHPEGRGSSGRRKRSLPTEEQNKASFRRYLEETWNQSNLEVVDEIFDRYISHQPDGSVLERGPEDVKRFVGEFRSAFPDLRLSSEEQIAEGDRVVSHGTTELFEAHTLESSGAWRPPARRWQSRAWPSSASLLKERWWRAGTPTTS